MDLGLTGRRVFITASSGGIGMAVAEHFLQEGAYVLLNGRNAEKLYTIVADFRERYGEKNVYYFTGDVTRSSILTECHDYIKNLWGGLDILVTNMGTGKPIGDDRLASEEWEKLFQYNLFSAVKAVRIFQGMLKHGKNSNIILVSSIVAYERMSAPCAYAAAKNGIRTLAKYLAGDLAEAGIRVNTVVPGNVFFKGGRWEELYNMDSEGVQKYISQNVPMKRFGTPDEIADAVLFLSSDRASFITGAELTVDGGQKRS